MSVMHEQIRDLAYRLWQEDGSPDGRSMDYWLRAEAALQTTGAVIAPLPPASVPTPPAKKAKAPAKPKAAAKPKVPAKPKAPAKSKA